MAAKKVILSLALFTAVAVILLNPVIAAVNSNTGTQSVTNETVTATFDERVELQGYDIDPNSETVWGYNDTSGSYEQATASDYDLHADAGQISFNNTTLIDSGEDVKVSYDYQATGPMTTLVVGFVPVMVAVAILVVLSNGVQKEL